MVYLFIIRDGIYYTAWTRKCKAINGGNNLKNG